MLGDWLLGNGKHKHSLGSLLPIPMYPGLRGKNGPHDRLELDTSLASKLVIDMSLLACYSSIKSISDENPPVSEKTLRVL